MNSDAKTLPVNTIINYRFTLYSNYENVNRSTLIKMFVKIFYIYAAFIFVFDGVTFFASCIIVNIFL